MKKYLTLLKTHFSSSITYRAELVSTLLMEALSVASIIILWAAIYRTQSEVAGYSFGDAITYYLIVPIAGFFTHVSLSDKLSMEIRNGFFSNYLLKPLRFWLLGFAEVLAGKATYLLLVAPVIVGAGVYLVWWGGVELQFTELLAALLIVGLAFIFHFVLDLAIAFMAFWLDDVWAFRHVKNILFSVFGGLNFPLDFVSGPFRAVLGFLPFQYLYYVPIMYLLGKRPVDMLISDIVWIAAWTVVVAIAAMILWRFGLRKYGAYGR